jgi:flagellar motor component MotA
MLGVGFFLIFVAVGIGASTSGGSELPKYLAGVAVVAIFVGAIWGALQGRLRRGK